MKRTPARTLTPRQERFVQEYLLDLNATKAAVRAGYCANNASQLGSRLVGKSSVKKAIDRERSRRRKSTRATAVSVINKLIDLLRFDPWDVIEVEDGTPRLRKNVPEGALWWIDSLTVIETSRKRLFRVRFANRVPVLNLLATYLGYYCCKCGRRNAKI